MANAKKMSVGFEPSVTVYVTVLRRADSYLLDDADGAFRASPVTDFAIALTANADQISLYEKSESRTVWTDGLYLFCFYEQLGASPDPDFDPMIASQLAGFRNDTEITDITVTSADTTTTDEILTDLRKLIKAILHDNKVVLDDVRKLKGTKNGNSNAGQKEIGSSRGRNR